MGWYRNFGQFLGGFAQGAPAATRQVVGALENRWQRQDEQDTQAYQAALQTGDVDTMNRLQQGNKRLGRQFSNFAASATVAATDEEKQAADELASLQQQYQTATSEQEIAALQQREAQIRNRVTAAQRRVGRLKPGAQLSVAPESGYQGAAQRVSAKNAALQIASEGIKAIDSGADGVDPFQVAKDIMALQHPELAPDQLATYSQSLGASFAGRLKATKALRQAEERARNASIAASTASIEASRAGMHREQVKEFMATSYMMDPEKAKNTAVGLGFKPEAAEFLTLNQQALADPNPQTAMALADQWRGIAGLQPGQDDAFTRALTTRATMNQNELKQQAAWYLFQKEVESAKDLEPKDAEIRFAKARQNYAVAIDEIVRGRVTGGAVDPNQKYTEMISQATASNNTRQLEGIATMIQNDSTLSVEQKKRLLDQLSQSPAAQDTSLPFMGRAGEAFRFGVGAATMGVGSMPAAAAALQGLGNLGTPAKQFVQGAAGR